MTGKRIVWRDRSQQRVRQRRRQQGCKFVVLGFERDNGSPPIASPTRWLSDVSMPARNLAAGMDEGSGESRAIKDAIG